MDNQSLLWKFLSRYVVEGRGNEYTHTSLNGSRNFSITQGCSSDDTGTYNIPQGKMQRFYQLCKSHLSQGKIYFIQTKTTPVIRFFVDIDSKEDIEQESLKTCVAVIRKQLVEWFEISEGTDTKALVLRNDSSLKKKIHIHFPGVLMRLEDARDFVETLQYLNNGTIYESLDFTYNGCRMVGAYKWERRKTTDSDGETYYGHAVVGRYIPPGGVTVKTLELYEHATPIETEGLKLRVDKEDLIPDGIKEKRRIKVKNFSNVTYTDDQINEIDELAYNYDNSIGEIREIYDSGLIIWWREKEGWCDQCKRIHEKDNTRYAFVKGKDVYMGCNKAEGEVRYVHIGELEEEVSSSIPIYRIGPSPLPEPEPDFLLRVPDYNDPIAKLAFSKAVYRQIAKIRRKAKKDRKKE